MKAHAQVVVEAHAGVTRFRALRSAPPLTLRRTGPTEVSIVGSAASPVGGDDLHLEVIVGPGAMLAICSIAASIAYPSPRDDQSSLAVVADVGEGAHLDWGPEPIVLVERCRHVATTRIRLASEATVQWRELVRLGRWGEPTGSLQQRTTIDRAETPLLRSDLGLGPAWPGWGSPAVLDPNVVAVGCAVRVGPAAPEPSVDRDTVVSVTNPLAPDAVSWTVLGRRIIDVRSALDRLSSSAAARCSGRSEREPTSPPCAGGSH